VSDFWLIIKFNWTLEERAELRAFVEAWMAADHSVPS
tara:strand:- start:100 stop:210 length:111 start_codon:yes stop_codon:yes gene_type:complete